MTPIEFLKMIASLTGDAGLGGPTLSKVIAMANRCLNDHHEPSGLVVNFNPERYKLVPIEPTADWVNSIAQDGFDNATALVKTIIHFAPELSKLDVNIFSANFTFNPSKDEQPEPLFVGRLTQAAAHADLTREELSRRANRDLGKTSPKSLANAEITSKGLKFDQDKPAMGLIDPYAIEQLSKVLGFGATKYAAHNWRKGIEVTRLIGAAFRHLMSLLNGDDNDAETGLSHAAHAMCCCMFLIWILKNKPESDDRFEDVK